MVIELKLTSTVIEFKAHTYTFEFIASWFNVAHDEIGDAKFVP